jgi:hypothetical protein
MRFIISIGLLVACIGSAGKIWDAMQDGPITAATFIGPVVQTIANGLQDLARSL